MKTPMAEKTTKRIAYIDWLRGFACLVMFQTHCYDSWLGGAARDGGFIKLSQLGGTLPAPLFLFLAGIAFGYFVTLPYILKFLVSFQQFGGSVAPLISINEYFDLILTILLRLGLVFELPILISACMTLSSGPHMRTNSVAPNAFL